MAAREFTKKRRKSGTAASVAEPSSTNAPNAREFTKQQMCIRDRTNKKNGGS